jgi:hypothetical protein
MKAERNALMQGVAHCSLNRAYIVVTTASLGFTLMNAHLKKATTMSKFNEPTVLPEPKTQQEFYDELRNGVIEEVAKEIEKMKIFGNDTLSSFAIYIRSLKK